jgi:hypothetical protein
LLQKTSEFAWRALRELHRSGPAFLDRCKIVRNADLTPGAPGARELVGALAGLGSRMVERAAKKALDVEQWFLAWRWRETRFGDARAIAPDLRGYTRAMPPRDRDWSTPFAIAKNGRHFVFFAERLFATGKSHISMIEVKPDGTSKPVRVLERESSLSHPFLLEERGELYMIPHSVRDGAVQVYRCVDFPLRWKPESTLLPGARLAQATFHRAADRWWMFAEGLDDELHLFHAADLVGDWTPHALSPVRSDARCARPAGQLFVHAGALYRPAQIGVPRQGAGLSINRVLRLTPADYAERQVERIFALEGLRTLSRAGDLTVIDAYTRRSRFA